MELTSRSAMLKQVMTMDKFLSRKFLLSAAAFLAAFFTGVAGVFPPEYCAVGMALSAGIYAASEAYVDGKSAEAHQSYYSDTTMETVSKNVNANTDSTTTANKIIGSAEPKSAESKKEG